MLNIAVNSFSDYISQLVLSQSYTSHEQLEEVCHLHR
jgi:hypothetical protein